jgi:electron transfer flavoprotein alpha subunit
MNRVLVIAEHNGATLNAATAKCVSCALQIGGEVSVIVLGSNVGAVAQAAAALTGVSQVLTSDSSGNASQLAAVLAPQLVALAPAYSHVLAPSTTFGKDLLPRVAALLDVGAISDIMAVESPTRFRRPIYAGNALVTVEAGDLRPLLGTVRTASFEAAKSGGSAAIASAPLDAGLTGAAPSHTRFVSISASQNDRPDLQSARRVISGGRAFGSAENFQQLYALADALGAAVGASRAAVDAGYAANELQVGQTGKIIAPELYIALGISGAIQHLTGIKDARTIVAINKDADAPIFEVADYGLVADLFQVLPELTAALQSRAKM